MVRHKEQWIFPWMNYIHFDSFRVNAFDGILPGLVTIHVDGVKTGSETIRPTFVFSFLQTSLKYA